ITAIGGALEIINNNTLISLSALGNLNFVGGSLMINHNEALISLAGLNNITSLGGVLYIEGNAAITNLWGLENIDPGSVNELHIFDNASLSYCSVQSVCEYLVSPGATIQIYNNAPGCNNPEEVEEVCEIQCLYEGITFTTQVQIDSFQINYPGCFKIGGDVEINGDDIFNLNGLNVITSIGGALKIFGNPSLLSLAGLGNLPVILGMLEINDNDALLDLTGLDNLAFIGGGLFIDKNNLLSSLTGLENLVSIINGVTIGSFSYGCGNLSLSNLSGLINLASIGGGLTITLNPELTNLAGLDNLSSIVGGLKIRLNESLVNITGLSSINPGSISNLMLTYNFSLSDCAVQSICDYLASPNGTVVINNNAPGCNSQQEVEDACWTSVDENSFENIFFISPNPINSTTLIQYTLHHNSPVTLKIFDLSGRLVVTLVNEFQQQGEQRVIFKSDALPAGVYFCVLKTINGKKTKKILKL
ncbi:MAG: T9SS type A sorting domain-containing protein, partial [Bacteroidales bacterium]|nr:T9SS type A sorting domain-containing protein [Bacteroidales bacterium]